MGVNTSEIKGSYMNGKIKIEDDLKLDEALEMVRRFFEDGEKEYLSYATIKAGPMNFYVVERCEVVWEDLEDLD